MQSQKIYRLKFRINKIQFLFKKMSILYKDIFRVGGNHTMLIVSRLLHITEMLQDWSEVSSTLI